MRIILLITHWCSRLIMSKRAHFYLQADFCKGMADKASSTASRERWLILAAKWLALADETFGDTMIEDFSAAAARVNPAE